jgi:ethanolamine utilization protein EutN
MLGQVTGRIWSERELPALAAHRLVTVRPAGRGEPIVAVDLIDVSDGNIVLLATDEAAQAAVDGDGAGIDAAVVALVAGADRLAELLADAGTGG